MIKARHAKVALTDYQPLHTGRRLKKGKHGQGKVSAPKQLEGRLHRHPKDPEPISQARKAAAPIYIHDRPQTPGGTRHTVKHA